MGRGAVAVPHAVVAPFESRRRPGAEAGGNPQRPPVLEQRPARHARAIRDGLVSPCRVDRAVAPVGRRDRRRADRPGDCRGDRVAICTAPVGSERFLGHAARERLAGWPLYALHV